MIDIVEDDPFDIDYEENAAILNGDIFEKKAWSSFKNSMMDEFLENPFVLDSFILGWMRRLTKDFPSFPLECSRVIYSLCKVRGEKSISVYFPCDIAELPEFIDFYENTQFVEEDDAWTVKYVLLIWLGQYLKQPFDLFKALNQEYKAKLHSIVDQIKLHASSTLLSKPACIILARIGIPGISNFRYFNELSKLKPLETDLLEELKSKAKTTLEINLLCKIFKRCNYGLDALISFVFYKDGMVHYTAAKAVSHLISKASNSKELIDSILKFLSNFSSFKGTEIANAYHGGALLLGELFKHRCVLEEQLPLCNDLIFKFLEFEYCKGTFALGSNVRDAACYAVWSLARFNPSFVQSFIYHQLILMSLFDREVGCRRAAAAAFQEVVGRAPDGRQYVEMLQFINFSTANADPQHALEQLLCNYGDYCREYFVKQFVLKCLMHWDIKKRKHSSTLVPLIEKYYPEELNAVLQANEPLGDEEYSKIHGYHMALAHRNVVEADLLERAYARIIKLDKNDVGFELLSESYLSLLASHPPQGLYSSEYIMTCLLCKNPEISELAGTALEALFENLDEQEDRKKAEDLCKTFLAKADKSLDPLGRIGYARALGTLPKLHSNPGSFLRLSLKLAERKESDYMERLTALQSHHRLLLKFPSSFIDTVEDWEKRIVALGYDWTRDTRGDVGSFIRIQVLNILTTCKVHSVPAEALAWRMACERMDKVRHAAFDYWRTKYSFCVDGFFPWLKDNVERLDLEKACSVQIALGLMSVITGFGKPHKDIPGILEKVKVPVVDLIESDFDKKLYKKFTKEQITK